MKGRLPKREYNILRYDIEGLGDKKRLGWRLL